MTMAIEAQGLVKRYGKTPALDGLDLAAERGQVVAVLGPNGAGKTTFVRAVATLLRLDGGLLRVVGHDVASDPRSRLDLWQAIRNLVDAGTDVLLTTQYLDEADHLASQVVIIDRGRSVATGTPAELKALIGGRVIELHVRHARDIAGLSDLLGGSVRIDDATRRITVRVDSGREQLTSVLRSVDAASIELEDISLRQPNLDEVFLALTGEAA